MGHPSPIIVDTSHSPYARLKPVPLTAVTLDDAFWAPRRSLLREATLPSQFKLIEETGRLDNFRRVSGKVDKPFQGYFFNDSDVYKWIEAAAWTLATDPESGLAQMVDTAIDEIAAAPAARRLPQYLLRARTRRRALVESEGHARALLRRTPVPGSRGAHPRDGQRSPVEHRPPHGRQCLHGFGPPETGKRAGTCGHPEIEMGLVELARATGDGKYLAQAQYFVDVRGHGVIGSGLYVQDHRPFRELDRLIGHAVRALYLNGGAADLVAESGEAAVLASLARQWQTMTSKQMYISGGVGSRHEGEAFGDDYEMPNARAYTETCAAIALIMWAWRMLALDGDARYADIMELAFYNGFLIGIIVGRAELLLRQPAGQRWHASPPAVVQLRVLPSEHRPAAGLAPRLCLQRNGHGHLVSSVYDELVAHRSAGRPCREHPAGNRLPLGWRRDADGGRRRANSACGCASLAGVKRALA